MPRKRTEPKVLDTIWEVSDDLWARILPILQEDWKPSPKGGQPPEDWRKKGVMGKIWASLVAECDELGEVCWDWQSADGRMGKARFGGGKCGEKSPPAAGAVSGGLSPVGSADGGVDAAGLGGLIVER